MGLLDDLKKKALNEASLIYNQVNPLDNNRTYKDPQGTPVYSNAPPQSAVHQITHNGLTNGAGSLLNNFTGIPSIIDAGRLGVAEMTHNQQAAGNATVSLAKNLPRFMPIAMTQGVMPFAQDVATAVTAPFAERSAAQHAQQVRQMYNNRTGDPVHDAQVDSYASAVENDLLNQHMQTAGFNQNTPSSQLNRQVIGRAGMAAGNVALAEAAPAALTGNALRSALTYGTMSGLQSVAGVAAEANPTAKQYIREGLKGAAMGAAFPVAGAAARKAMPVVEKGATGIKDYAKSFGPEYAGLKPEQIIMNPADLDTLHITKHVLATNYNNVPLAQQSITGLHRIMNTYGHNFINGSRAERMQKINQFLEQNGEAIGEYQKHLMQKQAILDKAQKSKDAGFLRLPGKKTELMVTHNLNEDKLAHADQLGGIPQASVAITDPMKHALDGFGDITLVGNEKLVDPKAPKTGTYAADVYSPRQPRAYLSGGSNVTKALRDQFKPTADQIGQKWLGFDSANSLDESIANEPAVMAKFLSDNGQKVPSGDRYDLRRAIDDAGLRDQFNAYAKKTAIDAGAQPVLYAGTTASGNHREIPETMDNALKLMRKEKQRGGADFISGTGDMRAIVTPKFKSLQEIVDSKDKLTTTEKMEAAKELIESKVNSLQESLDKYATNKDENQFTEYDRQMQAIGDYLRGGRDAQWFHEKFPNLPASVLKQAEELRTTLKNAPTEYFESVSDRAVQLQEFEKALVPENASPEAIARLKSHGIDPIFYKEGERQQMLQKLMEEDNAKRFPADQSGADTTQPVQDAGAIKREIKELDRKINAFGNEDTPAKQNLIDRRNRRQAELDGTPVPNADRVPVPGLPDGYTMDHEGSVYDLNGKEMTLGQVQELHQNNTGKRYLTEFERASQTGDKATMERIAAQHPDDNRVQINEPTKVYHGTTEKIDGDFRFPLYTTTKKDYAQTYSESTAASSIGKSGMKKNDAPMVHEFTVNPKARVLDATNPEHLKLLNDEYYGKWSTSDKHYPGKTGHIDWTEGENLAEWIDETHQPFDAIKLDEGGGGIDPSSGLPVPDKGISYMALNKNALSGGMLSKLRAAAKGILPNESGAVPIRKGASAADAPKLRKQQLQAKAQADQSTRVMSQKNSDSSNGSVPPKPPKQQLPSDSNNPDTAISKFPNRLLEEDRTEPIHKSLLRQVTHDILHNKDVVSAANKRIAANEESAVRFAKNGTTTEANATALVLLDKYLSAGKYDQADDLLKAINPRFTRQGQETQILAIYSKFTPAGAVRYATRQVEKATEKSGKAGQAEDQTNAVHEEIQKTQQDAANQIAEDIKSGKIATKPKSGSKAKAPADKQEKTPAEKLADRIKVAGGKKSAPDPIKDMVDTLHKVAKEHLAADAKPLPRDPMELIGQAIRDKKTYGDVYKQAKALVMDKYKDNEKALEQLQQYFNTDLERSYSKGQLNRGIQNGLKEVDLGKLVREHYTKVDETGQDLRDKLIEQAGLSKDEATQLASDIQSRFSELTQAKKDSILKQMFGEKPTPEQKSAGQKIIEMSNLGALSRDDLRPLVAEKLGLPHLSQEAASQITEMANRIQTMKEGSPERMRASAEMMQFIGKQVPSSFLDKAIGTWKAGLLTGIKTVTGNALSNGTFRAGHEASMPLAMVYDRLLSPLYGGKISQAMVSPLHALSGAKEGVIKGFDYLKTGIDEKGLLSNKFLEDGHHEINFKNKLLNIYVNGVFRNMAAQDRPFFYSQLRTSLAELATVEGKNQGLRGAELKNFVAENMKEPSLQMMERAKAEADKSVLANETSLSQGIGAMRNGIDRMDPGIGKTLLKTGVETTMPFTGVPSAFVSRVLDFTPAGPLKLVADKMIHGKSIDQRDLSTALAEATTGTAVMWLGSQLAAGGLLSGAYPNDPKEQSRWKTLGITPNSIKIAGTWRSANYLGPAGMLLNAGARAYEAKQGGSGIAGQVGSAVGGMPKDLTQQSFLQGLSNAVSAVNDPGRYLNNYINSQAGSTVPTLINDTGNAMDPYVRDKNNVGQAVQNRIPYVRQNGIPGTPVQGLPISNDVFGNQLKQTSNPVDRMINPLRPSTERTSPMFTEINRLTASNNPVMPTPIPKKQTFDGVKVNLTDAQNKQLQVQVGQKVQSLWNQAMATPDYQQLDDAGKKDMLDNIYKKTLEAEKSQYSADNQLGQYSQNFNGKAAKLSADAKNILSGNIDITKFAQTAGSSGTSSSSSQAVINKGISGDSKNILKAYNAMDTTERKKYFDSANDAEYKYNQAKYENDKAAGSLTKADDARAQYSLAKDKVGAGYSKEVRDLYGLNKTELWSVLTSDPKGNELAQQIVAYGDALQSGKLGDNKFRDSKGNVSLAPTTATAKSGTAKAKSNASKIKSLTSAQISSIKSGNSAVVKAKVTKKSLSSKMNAKGIAAYKKPSSAKVTVKKQLIRSIA